MLSDRDWNELQAQEDRLTRLFQTRNPREGRRWYDSAGLMAVAAALVTTLGSYLLKTREDVIKREEARLEQMRTAAKEANSLLATMLKANEERLLLAQGKLDKVSPDERHEVTVSTNRLQQQWRQKREDAELGLLLTFSQGPQVSGAWSSARGSIEGLTKCVEDAFEQYQGKAAPADVCDGERSRTLSAVRVFREELIAGYTAGARKPTATLAVEPKDRSDSSSGARAAASDTSGVESGATPR